MNLKARIYICTAKKLLMKCTLSLVHAIVSNVSHFPVMIHLISEYNCEQLSQIHQKYLHVPKVNHKKEQQQQQNFKLSTCCPQMPGLHG